jgi:hypothetical protein
MTPAERASRIVEVARANPDALLKDLAAACERSESWTRKVLLVAGVTPLGVTPKSKKSVAAAATRTIKKLIRDAESAGCRFEQSAVFSKLDARTIKSETSSRDR